MGVSWHHGGVYEVHTSKIAITFTLGFIVFNIWEYRLVYYVPSACVENMKPQNNKMFLK